MFFLTAKWSYSSKEVPKGYKCGGCKKSGLKLWREYNTFLDHQSFLCATCALEESKKSSSGCRYEGPVDANGRLKVFFSSIKDHKGDPTDQIGWRVPAIPVEDESTYWGYSSVPMEGVQWWRSLPTYLEAPKGPTR